MSGNFEASALLLDEIWDVDLANLKTTSFIAAAPARDILAFCDASSKEGLAELRAIVERTRTCEFLLRPVLYRRTGKSWLPAHELTDGGWRDCAR